MKHFATVVRMMFQELFESDCESRFSKKQKTKIKKQTNKKVSKMSISKT